jgi:type IV pilus assembly protein PilB
VTKRYTQITALLKKASLITTEPDETFFSMEMEGPIRTLARKGLIDERQGIQCIAQQLEFQVIDLEEPSNIQKIKENFFEKRSLFEKIDKDLLYKYSLLPLWETEAGYVFTCANPYIAEAHKVVEFILERKIILTLSEELLIKRMLNEIYQNDKISYDVIIGFSEEESIEITQAFHGNSALHARSSTPYEQEDEVRASQPIIRLFNQILVAGVKENASDIHIEPQQSAIEIKFRIDGSLRTFFEIPKRLQGHLLSRIKLVSGMNIAEKRRPQDGRIGLKIRNQSIDIRASCLPAAFGEKIVLRILKDDLELYTLEKLPFTNSEKQLITNSLDSLSKLLIVTGPTGSGKTTTLYAFLQYLKKQSLNIATVENPIEYRLQGLNQTQIHEELGVTFSSALRSILRQDPDIIMIGEIRDKETADIALQAGETGHLVLSTLHSTDPLSTLIRLKNLGIEEYKLSSGISGILSQRLVRTLCEICADLDSEPNSYLETLLLHRGEPSFQIKKARGCTSCGYIGFKGRRPIFSYLPISEKIANLIYKKASSLQILELAKCEGYTTLEDSALRLLREGKTTLSEVKDILLHDQSSEQIKVRAAAQSQSLIPSHEEDSNHVHLNVLNSIPQSFHKPHTKIINSENLSLAQKDVSSLIKKQRILIIEDDEDLRSVYTMIFEKEYFYVITAENGRSGLEKLYSEYPDIILCDLMMPVMDGNEFLMRVRTDQNLMHIPVIMLTAANSENNETYLLDLGARDFLSKTSSAKVMVSRVRRGLLK